LAGLGYLFAGLSSGVAGLVVALFIGGLGASTQHPLASSLIAHAFAGTRSLKALGTYNFAGDIGKMIFPAAAALMFIVLPWRQALMILGALGVVAALAIFVAMPRFSAAQMSSRKDDHARGTTGAVRPLAFPLLLSVGVIDSATRMAFLTFLPFILTAKGASVQVVGLALTLSFVGGAMGQLVSAFIGALMGAGLGGGGRLCLLEPERHWGFVSRLPFSLDPALMLLPIVGIALNGTSSVLYGPESRHIRCISRCPP